MNNPALTTKENLASIGLSYVKSNFQYKMWITNESGYPLPLMPVDCGQCNIWLDLQ